MSPAVQRVLAARVVYGVLAVGLYVLAGFVPSPLSILFLVLASAFLLIFVFSLWASVVMRRKRVPKVSETGPRK